MTISPPKLLTGVSLLFWGGATEHVFIGLIAAILVEANSWTSTRWNLNGRSYVRAWNLSILSGATFATLAWLNGIRAEELHNLFIWVPLFFLPLELAQRYGTKDKIELNTFLFFARKKWQRDTEIGRETTTHMINTGYPYIAIITLAAAMASKNGVSYFIGLAIIVAACLYSASKKSMIRPWAWSLALLTSLLLAFTGQWLAGSIVDQYENAEVDYTGRGHSANESRTAIGKLGKIKLSPRVFWRMKIKNSSPPKLLTTAIYNSYAHAIWRHQTPRGMRRNDDYLIAQKMDFMEDSTIHIFDTKKPSYKTNREFISITGALNTKIPENPIPLPHYTSAVLTSGKTTGVEVNSLGTMRMHNSEYPVIEYKAWQTDYSNTEAPPNEDYDLGIPTQETSAIRRVAEHLGLYDQSLDTAQKIQILRRHFNSEFSYTTHLKTTPLSPATQGSAIGNFLEKSKAGHCEYFATATTLLLREAKVYARYCVGFAVKEKPRSSDEWLIRGTAAHSWSRVWVDDHWENVDLTPSSWSDIEASNHSQWRNKILDWWQLAREDFLLWRTDSDNKAAVFKTIMIITSLISVWIIWRLWNSRQSNPNKTLNTYQNNRPIQLTGLNQLEPLISKKIGIRPSGKPLGEWMKGISSLDSALAAPLEEALQIHAIIRFDPHGGSEDQQVELARITKNIRAVIVSHQG